VNATQWSPDPFGGGHRLFHDREDAGRALAGAVAQLGGLTDPIVLALPRGGVAVAWEVARALDAPLDVLVVRKLGHPRQPEYAIGAIASGGVRVLNPELVALGPMPSALLDEVTEREMRELERRERAYRGAAPPPRVEGRSVVLVDDGVATGSTMSAAVAALRRQRPLEVIVAVPVAPSDTCARLEHEADRLVCLRSPEPFIAIGVWYEDFDQVDDATVRGYLERARGGEAP